MPQDFVRHRSNMLQDGPKSFWAKIDFGLLIPILCLCIYGLYILYSASGQNSALVIKQGIRLALGFFVIAVVIQIPQSLWLRYSFIVYSIGLLLLMAVLLFGTDAKGAQRWIVIPGVARFQPSEIMKLAIPLYLAATFNKYRLPPRFSILFFGACVSLIPAILIGRQPDLGTALLIAYSGFVTLIMAGLPWLYLISLIILSIPSAFIMWNYFMHDYQKTRVMTLLDPTTDPLGSGWNSIQSQAAIGSGGIDGKGWLQGTQSQLDFLPESHTDFIIAVIAEEQGFKGVLLLFFIYFIICARGLMIAWNAKDTFGRLLAGTLTLTFFIYIFVNVGMVSGILPVVGVPLPLVSYGGSSVVSLMAAFGFIMSIHAQHYR